VLEDILDVTDYVLVMSVNPGFGGQKFIPNALKKVQRLDRARRERGLDFRIEIDGGVNKGNVESIVRAGCDWLVAGSTVFHSEDSTATVRDLQRLAEGALAVRV
jgi:ribulose-phosphate 3-epimerase